MQISGRNLNGLQLNRESKLEFAAISACICWLIGRLIQVLQVLQVRFFFFQESRSCLASKTNSRRTKQTNAAEMISWISFHRAPADQFARASRAAGARLTLASSALAKVNKFSSWPNLGLLASPLGQRRTSAA